MTKEEALELKPGDVITGPWTGANERTITSCEVRVETLYWKEKNSGLTHSWNISDIHLKKKASLDMNYEIY